MRWVDLGTRSLVWVAAVFAAAAVVGIYVVRPFHAPPIGPDAAAPVVEFQRLLAGQRLEGYLSQTSKPLLTFVYGLAHGIGGWTAVSVLAIASYAAFAGLAALLAYRLAGVLAAAFATTALVLSPVLLIDVAFAYGVSWALLACVIAGLAVSGSRPHYAVAGSALAAGALARPELLAVTGLAIGWVAVAHVAARTGRLAAPSRGAWLVTLGVVAIPVLMAHDGVLKGDPFFWLNTAQANSANSGTIRNLRQMVVFVGRHVLGLGPVVVLAGLAIVDQLARRRPLGAILVTAVPMAVAAFFIASGARGTSISVRYLMPIDLGMLFAAGVGLGALDSPHVRSRLVPLLRRPGWRVAGAVAAGFVVALLMVPTWPNAQKLRQPLVHQRAKTANAAIAFAQLATLLRDIPPWRGVAVPTDARTLVLVPPRLRAQGIVDLDLPLWAGTKSSASFIDPAAGRPEPGTIVYHDATDDKPNPAWRFVEVTEPTVTGGLRFVPMYTDPAAGIWIVRVESGG